MFFAALQLPDIDLYQIVPVLVYGFLMAATLLLELRDEVSDAESLEGNGKPVILSLGAIVLTGLVGYYLSWNGPLASLTFNSMLINDTLSRGSGLLIAICAIVALLSGPDELERYRNTNTGEFCALIFGAGLGMTLMSSATNTMVIFLGLELFSLALYLLCIFFPDRGPSRESGMKYFLLSSAASAVMLYGMALLYGATGTTWLMEMESSGGLPASGLALAGTALVLCGLLFKIAAVPFHFWAPDVYEGAPTTVTAFMSVATKVAALAALWRFNDLWRVEITGSSGEATANLTFLILFSLASLSILVGNFAALVQKNLKRMLAYSGVANAGYLLIAPIVLADMQGPMLFFLAAYLVGNVGAFLAVAQIEAVTARNVERSDISGLFHRHPFLAGALALCLVSLTGLPPAAGFMAKFLLFGRAIQSGELALPVVGIAGSLVGAGYYLGTAIQLFSKPSVENDLVEESIPAEAEEPSAAAQAALAFCCLGILVMGLFPGPFIAWFSMA